MKKSKNKHSTKSLKQLESQLISSLTAVCEQAKQQIEGFIWLTHQSKAQCFEQSLIVTCVFDTKKNQQQAIVQLAKLQHDIIKAMQLLDLHIVSQQIQFDNEESCKFQHNGNWAQRLVDKSVRH